MPRNCRGVGLQVAPGRHGDLGRPRCPGCRPGRRLTADGPAARRSSAACRPRADHVFAQEHLMRRVRRISLALVDERRGLVDVCVDVVRGAQHPVGSGLVLRARLHHEVRRAARHVQRIIRRQRNVDRAVGAVLADQVEAMIEELAEEREEAVGGRRQAGVRGDVGDEQALRQARNGLSRWRTALVGVARLPNVVSRRRCSRCRRPTANGRAGIVRGAVDAVRRRAACSSPIAMAEAAEAAAGPRTRSALLLLVSSPVPRWLAPAIAAIAAIWLAISWLIRRG